MPRRLRVAAAGFVYHMLNRAVGRSTLFRQEADYAAFEKVLREAHEEVPLRLLAFCLLPNHWHLVVWPKEDNQLSRSGHWLTMTHTQRWHAHHHTTGRGPLYQGRFKSFPVQEDEHFLTVCRYVEAESVAAGLVERAEQRRWSSLWHRSQKQVPNWLHEWPTPLPAGWRKHVNAVASEAEVDAVRRSVLRGTPFGEPDWQERTAERVRLQATLRLRGRPRKTPPPRKLKAPDPFDLSAVYRGNAEGRGKHVTLQKPAKPVPRKEATPTTACQSLLPDPHHGFPEALPHRLRLSQQHLRLTTVAGPATKTSNPQKQ